MIFKKEFFMRAYLIFTLFLVSSSIAFAMEQEEYKRKLAELAELERRVDQIDVSASSGRPAHLARISELSDNLKKCLKEDTARYRAEIKKDKSLGIGCSKGISTTCLLNEKIYEPTNTILDHILRLSNQESPDLTMLRSVISSLTEFRLFVIKKTATCTPLILPTSADWPHHYIEVDTADYKTEMLKTLDGNK
jgi:hypothetical protein